MSLRLRAMMRSHFLVVAVLALGGCDQTPEYVYVPAENYQLTVRIEVPKTGRVGEWLTLRATRQSGPWKRIRHADVVSGASWFVKPPPSKELEVADNLHWLVDPPGTVRFDVPVQPAQTHERRVMFSQPGSYRLKARTAYPTEALSNLAVVEIQRQER